MVLYAERILFARTLIVTYAEPLFVQSRVILQPFVASGATTLSRAGLRDCYVFPIKTGPGISV